ncbi:unnamed protein product [Eruca vesicaria subsp. sativa]|uniref:Uncharacterized protein n=1 Tax=Eruca vesicaria subsp. sativa TaxID=29727 RepID=A0ABC8LAE9_ERUVS|nr:unnamed protein product [Eruca vesicaria subsp. sativa]
MAEQLIIQSCFWDRVLTKINYQCACGAQIRLMVFRSGQYYMHVDAPHEYPVLVVDYEDEDVFHIQSNHCNVIVQFYCWGEVGYIVF